MQTAETLLAIYGERIRRNQSKDRATGEPDDAKVSSPVRRGADGKGRSRLPVTADAYGLTNPGIRRNLASRLPYENHLKNVKPFIETLRVTNPVRQSRASSRKRVLRGGGRLPLRSVDSEVKRCTIEPRNFFVVSPRLGQSRGPSQALAALGPTSLDAHAEKKLRVAALRGTHRTAGTPSGGCVAWLQTSLPLLVGVWWIGICPAKHLRFAPGWWYS